LVAAFPTTINKPCVFKIFYKLSDFSWHNDSGINVVLKCQYAFL
jgi:hypothetical protein